MAYGVRIRDFDMSDYPAVKSIWEKVFTLRPTDDESHIKLNWRRIPICFWWLKKMTRWLVLYSQATTVDR